MSIHILEHPLAEHFITHLRDETTKPSLFRILCKQVTLLLAIEASRDLSTQPKRVVTPLETITSRVLSSPIVAVPILRAGLGMLDTIVELFPDVSVGYIGLARDETTAVASPYYSKLPQKIAGSTVFILDPMLATGGSATQAVTALSAAGAAAIKIINIVAAPEGIDALQKAHPAIEIYAGAVDRQLNAKKYILPGLGDFGDRLYGTG
jgi:uracil phosphoribosyltransferase